MHKLATAIISLILLSGCASNYTKANRIDENKSLSSNQATIVGFISEGYLTQPHGLYVFIEQKSNAPEEKPALISLETIGQKDEVPSNNILGNAFAYQVPAGNYEITNWLYYYYNGSSKEPKKPVTFNVKPGEIIYIGNIHGNALTMCLSNTNKYEEYKAKIASLHPELRNANIINKSTELQFTDWSHDNSTDIAGKGLCKIL